MPPDPKAIGRYQVQSMLGRGGMGTVYLAFDPLLKRQVVIKVVHEGGAGFAHALERFQREAEVSAKLNHPNIITVHDVGQDEHAGPFIAMEYVEGSSLAALIQSQALSLEAALRILVQGARGLMAAEALGIVHRDIKPENILVGRDGRVKITDFGIARTGESRLTTVGGVFGTPSYIAPELLVDAEASSATDCYALAVTAFELLTGSLPFKGDSVASTLLRIVNEPPAVPEHVAPAPRAVFLKALAKNPKDRYPDLYSFMAALIQAYPINASYRAKLSTLLAGEDASLTGAHLGGGPVPAGQTPLPSGAPIPGAGTPLQRPPTPRPSSAPVGGTAVARTPTPLPLPTAAPLPRTPTPPPEPSPRRGSGELATRAVPEPAPAAAGPRPESGPQRPPPPTVSATPPSPAPAREGRRTLLAVAASATGALLILVAVFFGVRALGFGSRELSLDSKPSGALVRVDGKDLGTTPLTKAKVAKRAGSLELTLPGYEARKIALLPQDRDLGVVELVAAAPQDPELLAMQKREEELKARIQQEEERIRKLREQGKPSTPQTPPKGPVPAAPPGNKSAPPQAPPAQVPASPPVSSPAPVSTPPQAPPAPTKAEPENGPSFPPSLMQQALPEFPSRARVMRFEPNKAHRVRVRVQVDEAGRPQQVQVLEGVSGPYGFNEAAVEAAQKSRFSPGQRNGRPAPGTVDISFVFQPLTR
ncbi:MAG: TonB family protein [Acidobacteria bacterium]|nr:TonB family protein [Acidobacteriota bacterium]